RQRLSHRIRRQLRHEQHALRTLVGREHRAREAEQLRVVQVDSAGARRHHSCYDLLSPTLRWDPDHGGTCDRGVRLERELHLAGIYVHATADDQLTEAPGDLEVAVAGIRVADIAGAKPPAGMKCLGRGLGEAAIPSEDLRAADDDLAILAVP